MQNNLELVENYDDIGVSAFRGLNAEQGALSRFLSAIKNGDVPRGSYLIIESMDRLTRQTVMTALAMLNEIISSGVTVVTLDDGAQYSAEEFAANQYKLFMAIGAMMRAHDESVRKSGLVSDSWAEKRKRLREDGKPFTARVPAWLRVNRVTGIVEPIPKRVAVIQEIFELACSGYGIYSIARLLNERGEKAWGTTRQTNVRETNAAEPIWRDSYVKKILVNRAVLGEFQPHTLESTPDKKRRRVPEGDVVTGYYPPTVSHDVFRDAQQAMDRRRNGARGRKGPRYANLFTGMIHCAACGSGMRYLDKGGRAKDGRYLKCSVAVSGAGCDSKSYRYEAVEQLILSNLETLDIEKVLGGDTLSSRLREKKLELEIRRTELEATEKQIRNVNALVLSDGGNLPAITLSSLRSLEHDQAYRKMVVRSLEWQLDQMLVIDPVKRRVTLDSLMKTIRDSSEPDRTAKARRALGAELQRMIETIKLSAEISVAPADLVRSGSERVRVENELDFIATATYRSGKVQVMRGNADD